MGFDCGERLILIKDSKLLAIANCCSVSLPVYGATVAALGQRAVACVSQDVADGGGLGGFARAVPVLATISTDLASNLS